MLDLQTKFDDTLFTNAIGNSDVWKRYDVDAMAKDSITKMYKENTVFENGTLYAKNTDTGGVLTDLHGVKQGLDSVTSHIQSKIDSRYISTDIKAQGGGTPPNQTTPQDSGAINASDFKDSGSFISAAMSNIK